MPGSHRIPEKTSLAWFSMNKTTKWSIFTPGGCPGGPIPCKYYYQVYSTDGGRHFSKLTPIHGVGCVRPRMLRLPGSSALLMTGGRPLPNLVPNSSFAGHRCLPQRGNGQGGIFVWLNSDGMADAPSGTAKHGSEWQTFCLGAIHNKGVKEAGLSSKFLFMNATEPEDVSQGNGQSQTYNSLVPLGRNSVFYQLGYSGPTASTWMMRIDIRHQKSGAEVPVQTDDTPHQLNV